MRTVYIAHVSRHNSDATRARAGLGYGSTQTLIVCSSDFDEHGDAKDSIRKVYPTRDTALQDAVVFLVLLPPMEEPGEAFTIGVELGTYIKIREHQNKEPVVVCLHHPDVKPPCILAGYPTDRIVLIAGKPADVQGMLARDIYPGVQIQDAILKLMTSDLVASVRAQIPTERHPTAVTVTITVTDEKLPLLAQGTLPDDAAIGGYRWEQVLGTASGSSGLTWSTVQEELQDASLWGPILAQELDQVREKKWHQNAVPILLRDDHNEKPAAAVVQKYEVYPDAAADDGAKIHRFSLVAFRTPMLYDSADQRPVASAYHLASVAQLFRFTIIERDLKVIKDLKEMLSFKDRVPDFKSRVATAITNIRQHLLLLDVESARREFLQRMSAFRELVLEAYGPKERNTPAVVKRQERLNAIMPAEWMPVYDQLKLHLRHRDEKLGEAVECLKRMASMNAEVLRIASDCYARLVDRTYPYDETPPADGN